MATPVSNSSVSALSQQSSATPTAPASSGVSSVGSSISSAAETQNEGFFACIFKPFISMWNAIISSLFPLSNFRADLTDYRSFSPNDEKAFQKCLNQFFHFSVESNKWQSFQWVQNDLPADQVKKFYDLLPLDMQKHMKRHIWEINGSDNDMGIFFGDAVVRDDIKGELVKKAIAQCLKEVS